MTTDPVPGSDSASASGSDLDGAEPLESPVWYGPLRAPSWLVPRVRDDAARVMFCAEPWDESTVDAPGRDLRLGVPMYLAESIRFGTNGRPVVMRGPAGEADAFADADMVVRSAVLPGGDPLVRLRIVDPRGVVLDEVVREAHDETTLGAALEGLPRACADALGGGGVRPIWNSLYSLPSGGALVAYVRGQRACLRVSEQALARTADAASVADRRDDVRAILKSLGSLATSTTELFPALLFFGALLAAYDVASPVVGESRLPANARCTIATDPLDPVYAISALVLRIFGDLATSERRLDKLRLTEDPAVHRWIDDVRALA